MREIKARAWHKENKRFIPIAFDREDYHMGLYIEHDGALDISHLEGWQWYTGLKDKNGVEIYEGDVVYAHKNESKYIVRLGEYEAYGYNDYLEDCCGFYLEYVNSCGIEHLGNRAKENLEVIGNIHENSELVK